MINIQKCLLVVTMLLLPVATSMAGPANPDPIDITQPDGSIFTSRLHGDEFQNWSELEETGHTIIRNRATGFWEYAEQNSDGTLRESGVIVKPKGENAPANIPKRLRPPRNKDSEQQMDLMLRDVYQQRLSEAQGAIQPDGSVASAGDWVPAPVSGSKKVLLVLVGFANRPFATTPASWNSAVFDTAAKSVAKYYKDNSFNTLNISPVIHTQPGNPDGVVSVTLATNHPNTGGSYTFASDQAWGNSALQLAAQYVDFNTLDTNGDGILDPSEAAIYFIVAGYETSASSGLTPSVWAHAWRTSGTGLTAGTKNVQRWSQSGEYYNATIQMPMGVIAHELGHQIGGLPDLYDTSSPTVNSAMGEFSLMAGGSWGADYIGGAFETGGTTPTVLDAWSREYLGWTTPVTPTTSGMVNLPHALSASNAALKLILPSTSATEYFLAENRYPTGWDLGLKRKLGSSWAGGLLLTHIDITAGTLGSNDINRYSVTSIAPGHQGVVPVQASTAPCNMLVGTACRGHATTLFYQGNNSNWGAATSPNSNYYNGTASTFALNNISIPASTMTAYATASGVDTPTVTTPTSSSLATTTATLGATIAADGGATITGAGVAYGTDANPDITGTKVTSSATSGVFTVPVSGLNSNTLYHYRGYATNSAGTGYSADTSFTTLASAPAATAATSIGSTSFTANWSAPSGSAAILSYRLDVSPLSNFSSMISGFNDLTVNGTSQSVTGLTAGTSYYYRVRAVNAGGVSANSNTMAIYPLTFSYAGTGYGSVNSNPSGIACSGTAGSACAPYLFNSGSQVSLTASADSSSSYNSTFTGWTTSSASCPGTGTCSITMNSPVNVSGGFNRDMLVNFAPQTSGTYGTILEAIGAASSGQIIQARDNSGLTPFLDDLLVNKSITLQGGFASGFAANNGYTTSNGVVTIGNGGVLTVERIIIK